MLVHPSGPLDDPLDEESLSPLDYVCLSPVFRPFSKPGDAREILGIDGLKTRVKESARPVIALGGIDEHKASALMSAGAAGVAVMGAVMAAQNPGDALERILAAFR